MLDHRGLRFGITLRDVGFGVLILIFTALIIPVQLGTMILFDSMGLDTVAPDIVFMALLPAIILTFVPAVVAHGIYARDRALLGAGGLFLTYTIIAAYMMGFYGMCGGPTC